MLEEQRIKRGVIRAADGDGAGRQHARSRGGRYTRRYPTGRLFALPVGFDDIQLGRAGLESSTTTRSSAARRSSGG